MGTLPNNKKDKRKNKTNEALDVLLPMNKIQPGSTPFIQGFSNIDL